MRDLKYDIARSFAMIWIVGIYHMSEYVSLPLTYSAMGSNCYLELFRGVYVYICVFPFREKYFF